MLRKIGFTTLALLLIAAFSTYAQRIQYGPNRSMPGESRVAETGLEVGTPLPDLTAYDTDGKPFSLNDRIKDSYSVIVLGCLT